MLLDIYSLGRAKSLSRGSLSKNTGDKHPGFRRKRRKIARFAKNEKAR